MTFIPVAYENLNAPQKEIYNFHKIAARLADFGYNCIRLSDDWQGADFLACHIDGETILRIQLKARLTIDRKYAGKGLYIAFRQGDETYVYPHDDFMQTVIDKAVMDESSGNWREQGFRSWRTPPKWAVDVLRRYKLPQVAA